MQQQKPLLLIFSSCSKSNEDLQEELVSVLGPPLIVAHRKHHNSWKNTALRNKFKQEPLINSNTQNTHQQQIQLLSVLCVAGKDSYSAADQDSTSGQHAYLCLCSLLSQQSARWHLSSEGGGDGHQRKFVDCPALSISEPAVGCSPPPAHNRTIVQHVEWGDHASHPPYSQCPATVRRQRASHHQLLSASGCSAATAVRLSSASPLLLHIVPPPDNTLDVSPQPAGLEGITDSCTLFPPYASTKQVRITCYAKIGPGKKWPPLNLFLNKRSPTPSCQKLFLLHVLSLLRQ